ncbi:MAG: sensor histidine kinase [Rhodospirillaceae bacterium]|nr:sensor histidine kinase [Rhodospirillaceae bacterium]
MRLRFLFFMTLAGIAVLPVIALASWIFVDALDREIESVSDKHLVIAKNIGEALERYAVDLKNGFELVAAMPSDVRETPAVSNFLKSLDLLYFCVVDRKTGVIRSSVQNKPVPLSAGRVAPDRLHQFLSLLDGDGVVFSPVMIDESGRPALFLLRATADRLFIAAVSTDYIVKQGKLVSFGEMGHAAIVDHTGNIIAHPLPAWRQEAKNIAKVPPVRRMLARETGTTVFYSPALKADMVTGFTHVPMTGWGVMVPQPVAELRDAATLIQNSAIGISVAGVIAAAFLSWFLSGYLTRALSSVVRTSRQMADGDLDARVEIGKGIRPTEIKELTYAFNDMAEEIAKTNRDLSEAAVQANFANRAKSEFLAIMSHDLRTPLNAIIGFSDAMRGKIYGPLGDARYDEYLGDIQKSGNVLLGLINDILNLSKIEAGRYELKETVVDLTIFLESSQELASVQTRQKRIHIELALDKPLPHLRCDERSLMQIVNNLLSNAVKFSSEGSAIRLAARATAAGQIEIEVSDKGAGMPSEEIREVLEPFSQGNSNKARKYEGSGLGLHICSKFMQLHGGTLEIESAVGEGTSATLCFPVERSMRFPVGRAAGAAATL